jgi:VHL beta domain
MDVLSAREAELRRCGARPPHYARRTSRFQSANSARPSFLLVSAFLFLNACGFTSGAATPSSSPDLHAVATFDGVYDVTYTMTALKDISPDNYFQKVGDKEIRIWTVTPRCPIGPCDVDATSVHPPSTQPSEPFIVHFATGQYVAVDNEVTGNCGTVSGDAFNATYTVTTRPSKYASSGSDVFVVELTGTRSLVAAPTSAAAAAGCTQWSVSWDVTMLRRGQVSGLSGVPATPSAPTAASPSPVVLVADSSCAREAATRSTPPKARDTTYYTIANHTTQTLNIYWLDYRGKREFWFSISPGIEQTQGTYRTHPWVVTDARGRCLRLFYAPKTIVIG